MVCVGITPLRQRRLLVIQSMPLRLRLFVEQGGQGQRQGVFALLRRALFGQLMLPLLQLLLRVQAGCIRRLPCRVHRLQQLCGFAGGQLLKFRRCVLNGCIRVAHALLRALQCGLVVGQRGAPLQLGAQIIGLARKRLLLCADRLGLGLDGRALFFAKQFHAVGTRLQQCQLVSFGACALEHALGDFSVNFGAGKFFQQFGAIIRVGVQERGEPALREQHRARKAREVKARDLGDLPELLAHMPRDHRAVALGQFDLRGLQRAIHLVARAALAP
ncbi:hypothetical protein SDC9_95899 [bioreactor metagenome]|uniref:Uncharacterized protein n=1 Tax=bioreactor metagenome TaxID=1076179 RepID=A0A645AA48_9ZZZZ